MKFTVDQVDLRRTMDVPSSYLDISALKLANFHQKNSLKACFVQHSNGFQC